MSNLVCECGETFSNKGSLKSHQNWCDSSDREVDTDLSREKIECPDCGSMVAETQLEKHRGSKSCQLGGPYNSERQTLVDEDWKNQN